MTEQFKEWEGISYVYNGDYRKLGSSSVSKPTYHGQGRARALEQQEFPCPLNFVTAFFLYC